MEVLKWFNKMVYSLCAFFMKRQAKFGEIELGPMEEGVLLAQGAGVCSWGWQAAVPACISSFCEHLEDWVLNEMGEKKKKQGQL